MPRPIDADALKDVIQQHDYPLADRLNSIDNGMFTLGIFQAIDEQPTLSPDDLRPVGKWIVLEPEKEVTKMRLIDADALKENLFKYAAPEMVWDRADLVHKIDEVPTIETIGFDFSDSGLSAAEIEEVCEAVGEVRQTWSLRIKRLPSAQPDLEAIKAQALTCSAELLKLVALIGRHDREDKP